MTDNLKSLLMTRIEHMRNRKEVRQYDTRLQEVNQLLEEFSDLFDQTCDNEFQLNTMQKSYVLKVLGDYLLAHILKDKTTSKTKGLEYPFHSIHQTRSRNRQELPVSEILATGLKRRDKIDEI